MFLFLALNSCENPNPNIDKIGITELEPLELKHHIDKNEMLYSDVIYVPIYSNIYVTSNDQKSLLAATLSIRNTSDADSLFISKIDYFDTEGHLVRNFINNPISLNPMATVSYVIEKDDDTGGSGANFIVELSAMNKDVKPIIQAIMIGGNSGNQGFAFSTDGYSIKKKEISNEQQIHIQNPK